MMRSFGYAAAVAGLPHLQAKERVIASSGAFMRGYRRATAGADFLPAREEMFAHLLEALTLERTLYEVRYELQTRPDWARIPIAYLHELAEVGP
jgi:maltose alpha-D-glucosyltransferase/alpha-amylase